MLKRYELVFDLEDETDAAIWAKLEKYARQRRAAYVVRDALAARFGVGHQVMAVTSSVVQPLAARPRAKRPDEIDQPVLAVERPGPDTTEDELNAFMLSFR